MILSTNSIRKKSLLKACKKKSPQIIDPRGFFGKLFG
jgi:hypothetical protein